MQTQDQIVARLNEILADERMEYKVATVEDNAPLALMQTALESQARILCWALGIPMKQARESFKEKGTALTA